jgi:hypothetical protein
MINGDKPNSRKCFDQVSVTRARRLGQVHSKCEEAITVVRSAGNGKPITVHKLRAILNKQGYHRTTGGSALSVHCPCERIRAVGTQKPKTE